MRLTRRGMFGFFAGAAATPVIAKASPSEMTANEPGSITRGKLPYVGTSGEAGSHSHTITCNCGPHEHCCCAMNIVVGRFV